MFIIVCVQVLSSHLMHSSLPGLTRLEQMFLVALADTVATTSAEVNSSTDQQYTGQYIQYVFVYRLQSNMFSKYVICKVSRLYNID